MEIYQAIPFPSGVILPYAGATTPSGYLLCYGQAISRTTYASLFAALGTTHGAGDGSTTFNLPDLRGRTIAGKDDMGGSAANRITNAEVGFVGTTLGAAGGVQSVTLSSVQSGQKAGTFTSGIESANHTHTTGVGASGSGTAPQTGAYNYAALYGAQSSGISNNHTHDTVVPGSAATNSHSNTQPTMILNWIIKE